VTAVASRSRGARGKVHPAEEIVSVLPVGVAMGFTVMLMALVSAMPLVHLLLIIVGAMRDSSWCR